MSRAGCTAARTTPSAMPTQRLHCKVRADAGTVGAWAATGMRFSNHQKRVGATGRMGTRRPTPPQRIPHGIAASHWISATNGHRAQGDCNACDARGVCVCGHQRPRACLPVGNTQRTVPTPAATPTQLHGELVPLVAVAQLKHAPVHGVGHAAEAAHETASVTGLVTSTGGPASVMKTYNPALWCVCVKVGGRKLPPQQKQRLPRQGEHER